MPPDRPPQPWDSFLQEIDATLKEPVVLECMGGFAMVVTYGSPRPTFDVDCFSIVPTDQVRTLHELAGAGTALSKKHGVYLQHVGIVTVPDNYQERLIPIFAGTYRNLKLLAFEAHDLALSKLERNFTRDQNDVLFLARTVPLDLTLLEHRYRTEMRPYMVNEDRYDLTMKLWLEMLRESC